jgi:O-antigen biosynthesis protein
VIDVIIPVFRGIDQTRRCIESVLAGRQRNAVEVVVVDDCSPEPAIGEYLRALAGQGRITLVRNESNEGFVRSVNRGMSLHADRDVVLLNSDTEVANDWVDRLSSAAYATPRIATVTPFSNNATICSYPYEGADTGVPGHLGLAALDRVFATANAGRRFDLPTAVGFCMLIRRECLDEIGLFDAERFGRGYGEENDFCMRAAKAGWRNILAADVFVFHEGSVSFQGERQARAKAANDALVEIHPEYTQKVRDFIVADPLRSLRDAIDRARVAHSTEEALAVVAERSTEQVRLLAQFREVESFAARRDADVGELHAALEEAQGLVAEGRRALDEATAEGMRIVAERVRIVAERDELIAQLREGLAHSESLAYSRLDELKAIRSYWLWGPYRILMSWRSPPAPRQEN